MKKLFLSLVIVFFSIGAFGALAQDDTLPSPGLTPDSQFYFLKTWKETIQTFFTFGEENKAKQFLHLSEVRLAEYQKMVEMGKTEIAQKTLDKYEKQLNHAISKVEELRNKGKDVKDLSQKLSTTTLRHIKVLERNLQKVPEAGKKGIEKALEAIRKGVRTEQEGSESGCISSGGIVSTSTCCKAVGDFPNLCLIGPCGCSPTDSHEVKTCDCGSNKCFDGVGCVSFPQIY